jgi:hypothetical protein
MRKFQEPCPTGIWRYLDCCCNNLWILVIVRL